LKKKTAGRVVLPDFDFLQSYKDKMFTTGLFTAATLWKKPRCPTTENGS
jgi:hypothetical protein